MPEYQKYPKSLWNVGSTANIVYVHSESGQVTVANLGDSRSMQAKGGSIQALSYDHKPLDQVEQDRIK